LIGHTLGKRFWRFRVQSVPLQQVSSQTKTPECTSAPWTRQIAQPIALQVAADFTADPAAASARNIVGDMR